MSHSGIAYYLKINNTTKENLNIFLHWVKIVNEVGADYFILVDSEDVKQKIIALYTENGYSEPSNFISSYREKLYGICEFFCTDFWLNTAYAHLTPYVHAKENGYSGFWAIDADDTVFYTSPSVCASLLNIAERYAIEKQLNVFSLDMWHSNLLATIDMYHWSFGVVFSNMNIDYMKIFSDCNVLLTERVMSTVRSCFYGERNIDTYFSVVIKLGCLSASSFCFEGLWIEHFNNWVSLYNQGKIEYEWHFRDVIEVPVDESVITFHSPSLINGSSLEIGKKIVGVGDLTGKNNIVLFGSGDIGKQMLKALHFRKIAVHYFCDNNAALWGKNIEGVKVIAPRELLGINATIIVTNRKHHKEIKAQLTEMGLKAVN